jgi:hypothetical protein
MMKGWEFREAACRYFVGAPDAATAKHYLGRIFPEVESAEPAEITSQLVLAYAELGNGTVRKVESLSSFDNK